MAKMSLFGIKDVQLPAHNIKLGGLDNQLTAVLSTDQQTVKISFSGKHPFGTAKFDVTFACTVANDVARLTPTTTAGSAAVTIEMPLELREGETGVATVFVTMTGEIAFVDTAKVLMISLQQVLISDSFKPIRWADEDLWEPFGVAINMDPADPSLVFEPAGPAGNRALTIADSLSPGPSRIHELSLRRVVATKNLIRAQLRPLEDMLPLHPDALTAAEDLSVSNAFLYQYSLVNGILLIEIDKPRGASPSLFWQREPESAEPPAVLLYRLTDEHGNPLFVQAASRDERFALSGREGVQFANRAGSQPEEWEQTNCAVVILGSTPVKVSTIDLDRIGPKPNDPDRQWLDVTGQVRSSGRGPAEIHGIAKGVFLRRSTLDGAVIDASFDAEPRHDDVVRHVVTRTDLCLNKAELWNLHSQREERDVYQGLSATAPPDYTLGQFTSAGKAGQALKLPAVDTSFAFANLADPGGRATRGSILSHVTTWIEECDTQFTGAAPKTFTAPVAAVETHVTGFAIAPVKQDAAPFDSIFDLPPGRASSLQVTARTPAWMEPQEHHYVHGGSRTPDGHQDLIRKLNASQEAFGEPFAKFQTFWNALTLPPQVPGDQTGGPAPNLRAARAALRKEMKVGDRLERLELSVAEFTAFRDAALDILYGGRRVDGLQSAALEILRGVIPPDITPARFAELWKEAPNDTAADLFDLLWAGIGTAVYRRAAVINLPDDLRKVLEHKLEGFTNKGDLPGFPTPTFVGLDPAVNLFINVWQTLDSLKPVRLRLGATLTPDVYQRLLTAEHRETLNAVLKAYFVSSRFAEDVVGTATKRANDALDGLRQALEDRWVQASGTPMEALRTRHGQKWRDQLISAPLLTVSELETFFAAVASDFVDFFSKLRFDPPEYIVLSSRFKTSQSDDARNFSNRLWNNAFRLASLGGASNWLFMLDSESTVIVKLTGTRSLGELLKEVTASYATKHTADPLGLGETLERFLARVDPDVLTQAWRGVFIVKPTADISADSQLSSLTGLSDITMIYAAVGGAKPLKSDDHLDVYAAIYKERSALAVAGDPEEDLKFTLVKFDATIRNTRLVAGEVIFEIKIRNLFGKDKAKDGKEFTALLLRGTVPRDKKDGGSFEFSAWFEQPQTFELDLAFIKSFTFKSLRVGSSRGQASVEIDADIAIQNWELNVGGFSFTVGPDEGESRLSLQNFRILVPRLPNGVSIPMGAPRLLNFELPAVSFNWPKPRPLTLWKGIEMKPIGMGFIRRLLDDTADLFRDLRDRYQWLNPPPEFKTFDFTFPYLQCEIDFGKLPSLGGTNLSRLNLSVLLGLVIRKGEKPSIALGIGGFDGSAISFDLFGVMKLELERLVLDRFKMVDKDNAVVQEAIALWVDNPRLTILGWSLLDESQKLQFLLAHAEKLEKGRAAIGFYGDGAKSDRFFKLHWLLIGHNIVLNEDRITQYLLSNGDEDATAGHGLLKKFVDPEAKTIAARIVEDDSWLLGASFDLGDIVKPGTFVMHDQHYYGISLRGPAIKTLFGVKRLELCYIPGRTRDLDRFRAAFRLAALDLIGNLRSGDLAIEWSFNWDFLLDFGFPWRVGAAYQWQRAFSLPMGTYEAKFGFYFEKRSQMSATGTKELTIGAGAGFYFGYYFGFGKPGVFVWLEAGIGVFAILEGRVTLALPDNVANPGALMKASVKEIVVKGVIGIYAYGEGGIELWVISARFRVSVQAAIAGELHYLPGGRSTLAYAATLAVAYSASCQVGCGFFSFTFAVSGTIEITVSGQVLLS